jgi:hypothetical protein
MTPSHLYNHTFITISTQRYSWMFPELTCHAYISLVIVESYLCNVTSTFTVEIYILNIYMIENTYIRCRIRIERTWFSSLSEHKWLLAVLHVILNMTDFMRNNQQILEGHLCAHLYPANGEKIVMEMHKRSNNFK